MAGERRPGNPLTEAEGAAVVQRAADFARRKRDPITPLGDALAALPDVTVVHRRPRRESVDVEAMRRRRAIEQVTKANGVPPRYAAADLRDLSGVPADVLDRYAEVARGILTLVDRPATFAMLGGRGPGKTWMACALVNLFCKAGRPALYTEATDYFVAVKGTFDKAARRGQAQVESDYLRPHLLVIDEMQERGDTTWEDRMLTRLVNKRYAEHKATLMVSNQESEEFLNRVGTSIADRICDDTGALLICKWGSLRGRISNG